MLYMFLQSTELDVFSKEGFLLFLDQQPKPLTKGNSEVQMETVKVTTLTLKSL